MLTPSRVYPGKSQLSVYFVAVLYLIMLIVVKCMTTVLNLVTKQEIYTRCQCMSLQLEAALAENLGYNGI